MQAWFVVYTVKMNVHYANFENPKLVRQFLYEKVSDVSTPTHIILDWVDSATSGTFKCEVPQPLENIGYIGS